MLSPPPPTLSPKLSACPLLPSGGRQTLLPLALCKHWAWPLGEYTYSKGGSCFEAGHTLHCSRPQINGYPLPNTKTKKQCQVFSSSRDDAPAAGRLSSLGGSGLPKVAQLPASQDSTQFHFTAMFRVSGHLQNKTKVSSGLRTQSLRKVGTHCQGLLANPGKQLRT